MVVADGFYEWQRQDGWKRPFFVHRRDDRPFAFAGLWEHWEKGDQPIHSCTLLTTDANEVLAPIHDRMPVIVPRSAYDLWLDPAVKDPNRLQPLLVPFPTDEMEAYPVSRLVNRPGKRRGRMHEADGVIRLNLEQPTMPLSDMPRRKRLVRL